ncbi:MAG: TetR/AcrR family transcriptional regulator [Bacteroidota bacterium]
MKEKILNKTIDLFLSFGVKSITMDDIAKELAISKKTIYTYFSTKAKLVEAASIYTFEKINKGIFSICASNYNPIEELYKVKSLILDQLKNEESSPQYQLQKFYPKIFETLKQKQFDSVNSCISENLKKGIESGYYRKEIDINLITRLYFNGMMGIKNVELFPIKDFSAPYVMNYYLEYHIRAIATEKGLKTLQNII